MFIYIYSFYYKIKHTKSLEKTKKLIVKLKKFGYEKHILFCLKHYSNNFFFIA